MNLGNLHIGADHRKSLAHHPGAPGSSAHYKTIARSAFSTTTSALAQAREAQRQQAVTSFKQALDYHRIVGNEEGLAVTYSQLGKCFLDQDDDTQAERCLNNASEHYIKLGNEPAEAAVLRLLATVYDNRQDYFQHDGVLNEWSLSTSDTSYLSSKPTRPISLSWIIPVNRSTHWCLSLRPASIPCPAFFYFRTGRTLSIS